MSNSRSLPTLLLLLVACAPGGALAIHYGASLHESRWSTTASRMQCTLLHQIPGYGAARFTQNAGEAIRFRLQPGTPLPEAAEVRLVSATPAWRHDHGSRLLQRIPPAGGRDAITLDSRSTRRLLRELARGMAPAFIYPGPDAEPITARLSPVQLGPARDAFDACTARLLPHSYPQIRQSRLYFDSGSSTLRPEARERADQLIAFVKENRDIRRIRIDGHTDNVGRRRYNRNLGRQRAEALQRYLLANGIAKEKIRLRSHGERQPRASNSTAAGRAANRRILVTLER